MHLRAPLPNILSSEISSWVGQRNKTRIHLISYLFLHVQLTLCTALSGRKCYYELRIFYDMTYFQLILENLNHKIWIDILLLQRAARKKSARFRFYFLFWFIEELNQPCKRLLSSVNSEKFLSEKNGKLEKHISNFHSYFEGSWSCGRCIPHFFFFFKLPRISGKAGTWLADASRPTSASVASESAVVVLLTVGAGELRVSKRARSERKSKNERDIQHIDTNARLSWNVDNYANPTSRVWHVFSAIWGSFDRETSINKIGKNRVWSDSNLPQIIYLKRTFQRTGDGVRDNPRSSSSSIRQRWCWRRRRQRRQRRRRGGERNLSVLKREGIYVKR